MIYEVTNSAANAFTNVWDGVINFLPLLLVAILVFVIGWFVSVGVGKLVAGILRKIKFNNLFENASWQKAIKQADINVDPSQFFGVITKWILVIIFLMISSDIIGWTSFTVLLERIILWIPNLIVAIVILVVAIVLADILEKIVKASVDKMGVASAKFLGNVTRWTIYIVAILAILSQLNIAPVIVNSIIIGLVGMFALAFGLAFGLGGKEEASKFLREFRGKVERVEDIAKTKAAKKK